MRAGLPRSLQTRFSKKEDTCSISPLLLLLHPISIHERCQKKTGVFPPLVLTHNPRRQLKSLNQLSSRALLAKFSKKKKVVCHFTPPLFFDSCGDMPCTRTRPVIGSSLKGRKDAGEKNGEGGGDINMDSCGRGLRLILNLWRR